MQKYVVNIIVGRVKTRIMDSNNAEVSNGMFIVLNNLRKSGLLKVDEVELTVEQKGGDE